MIFDKHAREIHWKRIMSSTNGVTTVGFPCVKKMDLDPYLIPYTKIYLKLILNVNIKEKHINV